ncbi:hypothetical protein O3P69_008818 [Scylla paramamosain]|uniref:Reverse transcriptase domain-containing protein n=1 Tax=Scylla paramamosain TaxID=85552 RepID=A0AAW0TNN2_SCYPA
MGTIETNTLQDNRPSLYCHYIDDILVRVKNIEEFQYLKERLTRASSLNFTYEESKEGRLPFLDVLVTARSSVSSRAYTPTKPTENSASAETANAHNVTYSLPSTHMSDVPSPTAPPGTQHTGNCNASHMSSLTTVIRTVKCTKSSRIPPTNGTPAQNIHPYKIKNHIPLSIPHPHQHTLGDLDFSSRSSKTSSSLSRYQLADSLAAELLCLPPVPSPLLSTYLRGFTNSRVAVSRWLRLCSSARGAASARSNLKAMLILPKIDLPFNNVEELSFSGLPLYENDKLEQYSRRENLRILGLEEEADETEGVLEVKIIGLAGDIGVKLKTCDISVAHRLGKPREGEQK